MKNLKNAHVYFRFLQVSKQNIQPALVSLEYYFIKKTLRFESRNKPNFHRFDIWQDNKEPIRPSSLSNLKKFWNLIRLFKPLQNTLTESLQKSRAQGRVVRILHKRAWESRAKQHFIIETVTFFIRLWGLSSGPET